MRVKVYDMVGQVSMIEVAYSVNNSKVINIERGIEKMYNHHIKLFSQYI